MVRNNLSPRFSGYSVTPMADLILHSTLQHSLLFIVPIACALVLRAARAPGWAVVGGVLAGVLLGPTIFGRVAPQAHEYLFIGGIEARERLESTLRRMDGELAVRRDQGIDDSDLLAARPETQLQLQAELAAARWSEQRPIRSYASLLIVLTMLGGGLLAVRRDDRSPSQVAALSIGLWSAAIPGAVAWAAMWRLWGFQPFASLAAASALAIGPWIIMGIDQRAADGAESGGARLVQAAGRCASVIAIVALCIGIAMSRGLHAAWWSSSLLAMPVGWMIGRWAPSAQATRARLRFWFDLLLIAPLACVACIRVDLFNHFSIWPMLVFLLLSADGRWLGALIGALTLGGRQGLRTMRLALGAMACGPTQLAVCAILVHTRSIPETIAFAIIAGAAMIEVTAPIRRNAASELEDAEQHIGKPPTR